MKNKKNRFSSRLKEYHNAFDIPVIDRLPDFPEQDAGNKPFIGDYVSNIPSAGNHITILQLKDDAFAKKGIYRSDFVIASSREDIADGDMVVATLGNETFAAVYFALGKKIRLERDASGKNQLVLEYSTPEFKLNGKIIQIVKNID